MARRKRVPYRPDTFQSIGRRVALVLFNRGALILVVLLAAAAAFVLSVVLVKMHSASEERAWAAFYRAAGDARRLREALEEYGSTSARPYMLYALGRADLEPPRTERGERKPEPPEERKRRLSGAEEALRALTEDHPDHFLNVHALGLLGLVLEEEGRHLHAVKVLERALDEAPSSLNPKIQYDIGRNYFLAGRGDAARPYLERASGATRLVYARSYGGPTQADWIENAKYLVAELGPGERAIPLPGAGGEKGLDESPPREKKPGKKPEERGGESAEEPPAEEGPETEPAGGDEAAVPGEERDPGEEPAGGPDPAGVTPP